HPQSIAKVSRDAAAERSAAASRLTELVFQRALKQDGYQSMDRPQGQESHRQRDVEQQPAVQAPVPALLVQERSAAETEGTHHLEVGFDAVADVGGKDCFEHEALLPTGVDQ